jgi:hypothetical protein
MPSIRGYDSIFHRRSHVPQRLLPFPALWSGEDQATAFGLGDRIGKLLRRFDPECDGFLSTAGKSD